MSAPVPLVAEEVDLRGMSSFMLDVDRLLASELVALGAAEECWAATMLWCRAWKQVPAASLPDDDLVLAAFSGAGKRWPKVRSMALRGFIKCSDGRLYHKVLAEEANKAWKRRLAHQEKRERDAERLRAWRATKHDGNDHETRDETRFVAERDRDSDVTGTKKERKEGGAKAPDDDLAFKGEVIRLKPDQLERWRNSYRAIPDIVAELTKADAYYRENRPPSGKWFFQAARWLAKANADALAAKQIGRMTVAM